MGSFDLFKKDATVILRRKGAPSDSTVIPEDTRKLLKDNTSIAIALADTDVLVETRNRELPERSLSTAVVQAFDYSIERLDWDEESGVYKLKFKNERKIVLSNLIKGSTPRYPDVQAMREYVKGCVSG